MLEFQSFSDINQVIEKLSQQKKVTISGLFDSSLSLFILELVEKIPQVIFVTTYDKCERYFRELKGILPEVCLIDEANPFYLSKKIIITTKDFFMKEVKVKEGVRLSKNQKIDIDNLFLRLEETDYTKEDIVEDEMEYAQRGGIFDIYLPNKEPIRIEFYGDEIFSLRRFNIQTQRSVENIEEVTIELVKLNYWARPIELMARDGVVISADNIETPLNKIVLTSQGELRYRFSTPYRYFGDLKKLREDIAKKEYTYRFFINNLNLIKGLNQLLGEIEVYQIPLLEGFVDEVNKIVYLTETEIFGEIKRRRERFKGLFIDDLKGLKEGDYVVHTDFGIGQFNGSAVVEFEGKNVECLRIDYADGDKVFLPVERLNLIERYIGTEDRPPKLSKLGSDVWLRTRERIKKATERLAIDLVNLYAQRMAAQGFQFSEDSLEMTELEATFPFEETEDQLKTIKDVKNDMESPKPQERLICGDVGYGKTEIALRAAFKAAFDGKQTMLICPTTLLAFQHYNTFKKRLTPFPVRAEMVSRFRKKRELKKILEDITSGKVDIAIGTHRLLQPDVQFKDLGLLIIDEEQRFGVLQKERIKKLIPGIDVLYLSATPIPRTLYMALTGLKDISSIHTPPPGRKDIITKIMYYDDEDIKRTIEFEIRRGGQVFYVHNRIQTIETVRTRIFRLLPELKICLLHGKMKESISEKRMIGFLEGKYNILLSTAIVESGLDMPRVNTIIVDEAHKFGLADLHQLRGRVGRGDKQAYAYFIIPSHLKITDEANKRMSALASYTSLGSGFRLALRDMEIRGIGNLLGREQSGYINIIGYHHYVKILGASVRELKGRNGLQEPILSLKVDAYFPEEYIKSGYERIALYKRLMDAESKFELDSIKEEIIDRFGRYPEQVENLFLLAKIRLKAIELGATEVIQRGNELLYYKVGAITKEPCKIENLPYIS